MEDMILHVLYEVYSMNYVLILVALLTFILFIILLLSSRNMWFNNKRIKWMGIFYSLSAFDSVRIACSWIKLCLVVIFLCRFKLLSAAEYFMLLMVGFISALDFKNFSNFFAGIFGTVIQIVGVMTANIVCSYILDLQPGFLFNFAYILMSIFFALFAVYLFLTELNAVSKERTFHDEEIETQAKE